MNIVFILCMYMTVSKTKTRRRITVSFRNTCLCILLKVSMYRYVNFILLFTLSVFVLVNLCLIFAAQYLQTHGYCYYNQVCYMVKHVVTSIISTLTGVDALVQCIVRWHNNGRV